MSLLQKDVVGSLMAVWAENASEDYAAVAAKTAKMLRCMWRHFSQTAMKKTPPKWVAEALQQPPL